MTFIFLAILVIALGVCAFQTSAADRDNSAVSRKIAANEERIRQLDAIIADQRTER